MDTPVSNEALSSRLEQNETIARAWVRIAAELTWMGDRADTGLSLDSLEGRALMLLTMRPFWLMSVLREHVGTDRSAMSRLVSRFEKFGWAVRLGRPDDPRQLRVAGTTTGRAAWEAAEQQRVEAVLRLVPWLDERDVAATEALLRKVTRMRQTFADRCIAYPRFGRQPPRRTGHEGPAAPTVQG